MLMRMVKTTWRLPAPSTTWRMRRSFPQGELEPDSEQEQHHAEFGHQFDGFAAGNQAQTVGAHEYPGQQIGDDDGLAGPV